MNLADFGLADGIPDWYEKTFRDAHSAREGSQGSRRGARATAQLRPRSLPCHSLPRGTHYHRRTLLGDHDRRRVGVGRGDRRHHRGVDAVGVRHGLLLLVGIEYRGDALGIGGERRDAGALDLQWRRSALKVLSTGLRNLVLNVAVYSYRSRSAGQAYAITPAFLRPRARCRCSQRRKDYAAHTRRGRFGSLGRIFWIETLASWRTGGRRRRPRSSLIR